MNPWKFQLSIFITKKVILKKPCATRTGRSGVIRRRKWGDSARQIGVIRRGRSGWFAKFPRGDSARRITPGKFGARRITPLRRAESPLGNLARAESPHCAAPNHPWEIWRPPNHPIAPRRITPDLPRRITPRKMAINFSKFHSIFRKLTGVFKNPLVDFVPTLFTTVLPNMKYVA